MSAQGLNFQIRENFGDNRRISAFFDFTGASFPSSSEGAGTSWTGVISNSSIAYDETLHKCYVIGSSSETNTLAESNLNLIANDSEYNLSSGAFQIPLDGLNLNDISTIIDFSFSGAVSSSVLFGTYQIGQETLEGEDFTTTSGFNVGVTDRGHLFLQYLNNDEEETIKVLSNVELSKRNVIGVSVDKSKLSLSYFDYFNDLVKTLEVPIDEQLISYSESILLGGANEFYEQNVTFEGNLNSFTILSGSYDPLSLKDISEGILGEYDFTAEQSTSYSRVTGYSESITYKTGITGYDYEVTGTLSIETGRETFDISTSEGSSESYQEGERYFKYYTLSNGDTTTKYKEELGALVDESGYLYYPTGEDAYDTLGLNDISSSIQTYSETVNNGNRGSSVSIDLYGKSPLTGVLTEVSGFVQTPLSETWSEITPASSGISLDEGGSQFLKNYIYYMGGRS